MLLDLNFKFKGLDGTDDPNAELPIAKYVANILANGKSNDPIKIRQIAIKLYNDNCVDLDKSDLSFIFDLIKKNDILADNAKAQILEVILPLLSK
jgi:hypothetical protein